MIATASASAVVKYHLAPTLVQALIARGITRPMFATEVTIEIYQDDDTYVYVYGLVPIKDGSRPDRRMTLQMIVLSKDDEAALLDAMGVDLASKISIVHSLA